MPFIKYSYCVIVLPPLFDGAEYTIVIVSLPGVADSNVGGCGTSNGVTEMALVDGEFPRELTALTTTE
jgi:hypothetical protein